ncbi:hypothetical protein R2G56_07015 [Nitratireductor aquimarinus]|uniref:Uncharacterized protein n=1 Tax=Nitratireductor aquimarinus TaxID=889300 RepID=A0ABU4AIF5_9HYPH|nr:MULTISPECIES: hypothetical protein [Nitratireductor]MDV6226034.1 hypothetical protein [Nitratireductor aquimarinus]
MFPKAAASVAILLMLHGGFIATMIVLDKGTQIPSMQHQRDRMPLGQSSYAPKGKAELSYGQRADVSLDEAHRHCDWLMPQLFGWCERRIAKMMKRVGKSLTRSWMARSSIAIPRLQRGNTDR